MRTYLIVFAIFLASCSTDPTNDITPLIKSHLNNGTWYADDPMQPSMSYRFIVEGQTIKDISSNIEGTNAHNFKFDGDTLRISYIQYGPGGYLSSLEFDLDWKLGKDIVFGYQSLKGSRSEIQFRKSK